MSGHNRRRAVLATVIAALFGGAFYAGTGYANPIAVGTPVTTATLSKGAPWSALASGLCWHTPLSDWKCPDSTRSVSATTRESAVARATLTVITMDGRKSVTVIENGVDAIFLTDDAVERFLVRYYQATDPAKAAAVQRYLQAR